MKAFFSDLHNWSVLFALGTWGASVLAVMLFPDPTRLTMAKDAGTVLLGLAGLVATAHTTKYVADQFSPPDPK